MESGRSGHSLALAGTPVRVTISRCTSLRVPVTLSHQDKARTIMRIFTLPSLCLVLGYLTY